MARITAILGVFCAWMTLLTLIPAYLLLSGRYTNLFVTSSNSEVDQLLLQRPNLINRELQDNKEFEGVPWMESKRLRRGVRVASGVESNRDIAAVDNSRPTAGVTAYSNKAVKDISSLSSSIKKELERILDTEESVNPRAPFEKVVALSSLLPKITNISRMKTPSAETFRNYIAPMGLPVIFTDFLEGQMLGQWTWEYIRTKWGKTVYHNTRQGNYSTKTSRSGKYLVNRVTITLEDFIDVVTGKRKKRKDEEGMYIAKKRVIPVEALEAEFYYPPFYPGAHKNCYLEPTGWIGSPGTFTQGHIDSKDNFVYQIIGKKQWTIFSPQDYSYLYYTKTKGSLEWSTVLNSIELNPDLKKYPLYAKATPVTFVMSPGEVLYLPRGWTHTVVNLTPNLMINTWRYGPAAITEYWSEKNRQEIRKRCY